MTREESVVLVMDSGVGGLSVTQHIQALRPDLSLLYLADNGALPYGNKSEDWLNHRVVALAQRVAQEYPLQLVVVACNTASTLVLPALRASLSVPVVGVVPAIKPAAALSQTGHIGLLATPGTVQRSYTDQLVNEFAEDCRVSRLGTTELVSLAEDKLAGKTVHLKRLAQAVEPLFAQQDLDTLVLGCTHFPLLVPELEQIAPRKINWVDSGQAIARRVDALLPQTLSSEHMPHQAILTAEVDQTSTLFTSLSRLGFGHSRVWPISAE